MEIINQPPPYNPEEHTKRDRRGQSLYLGIILLASGFFVLLYNFNLIDSDTMHHIFSWEVLLIALGGYIMSCDKQIVGGVIALFGLSALMIDVLSIDVPIQKLIIPLLLIVAGVYLVRRKR